MSAKELLSLYLYGIETRAKDGTILADEVIETYIASAQQEVEHFLDLKFIKQVIEEEFSFYRSDFWEWGSLSTSHPVNKALKLAGHYGSIKQIEYPSEWLSARKTTNNLYYRKVFIVPTEGSGGVSLLASGVVPRYGFLQRPQVPNYWRLRYCSGFDTMPLDLLNLVGKWASIGIFNLYGDIVLGAGIASMSLGLDSVSQSIATTSSAENAAYSARIKQYLQEIKLSLPRLKSYYKGIVMLSM